MATKKTSDVIAQRVATAVCAAMASRMIRQRGAFALSRRRAFWLARPKVSPARAIGTYAIGSFAIGAVALGAVAIGNIVIGRLGIARLRVRAGHIEHLRIDELEVGRFRLLQQQEGAATPNGAKGEPVPEVRPV